MMPLIKINSISRIMFVVMIFISTLSIIIVGATWGVNEYQRIEKESVHLKKAYIEKQKHLIRTEVQRAVEQANYAKNQTEINLKESIRNRVHEAHAISMNLYSQFHESRSDAEIKRMVVEALRNIRFNSGRGYYFATDFNGIEQLFADHPELEGKDLSDMQDSTGKYVIRDLIQIAKRSGEGYYRYLWTKPDSKGNDHLKIAYVKYFKPFNWFIGTGEYYEDAKEELQNEILQRLIKTRFGTNGYLFGSTYDGDALFTNGKITKGTNNIWDLTDPNGIKIIQEQRKAALNEEGDFYKYSWKKLNSSVPSPKLSFSMGIAEWNWMIGAGVYIDDIDEAISLKREILNNQIRNQFVKLIAILLVVFLGTLFVTLYFSSRTRQTFSRFLQFFDKASLDYVQIDSSGMIFSEFKQIANLANKVIVDREKAKQELSKSEKKHREILEGLNDAAYHMSLPDGKYDYMSKSAQSVFGYAAELWLNNSMLIREIIHPDFVEYFTDKWTDLLNGIVPKTYEYKIIDPDRREKWILQSNTGVYDEQKNIIAIEGLCRDITKQKEAEERIIASLKEKETLLHEIHHRVKNNMQVVASLLKLQSNSVDDNHIKEALKESQNRVYAMSAVYETLHGSANLSEIDLNAYLSKITNSIFQTYSVNPGKVKLNSDIEDSPINIKQAYPLGLIINELISNSLKYAFSEDKSGEITVSINKTDKELQLTVMDDGIGMPDGFDWENSKSLGLTLIRTLVEDQLDGSIDMESKNGTKFIIKFNIEA